MYCWKNNAAFRRRTEIGRRRPPLNSRRNFDDLYESYQQTLSTKAGWRKRPKTFLRRIQDRTYEKYSGQSEKETLRRLTEAVDALGNREEALRNSSGGLCGQPAQFLFRVVARSRAA